MSRCLSISACEPLESRQLRSAGLPGGDSFSLVQCNVPADAAIHQGLGPVPQAQRPVDFSLGASQLLTVSPDGAIWRAGQGDHQQLRLGQLTYFNRNELSLGRELGCSGFQEGTDTGAAGQQNDPACVYDFSGDSNACSIVPPPH
jgi:hypothetical protein